MKKVFLFLMFAILVYSSYGSWLVWYEQLSHSPSPELSMEIERVKGVLGFHSPSTLESEGEAKEVLGGLEKAEEPEAEFGTTTESKGMLDTLGKNLAAVFNLLSFQVGKDVMPDPLPSLLSLMVLTPLAFFLYTDFVRDAPAPINLILTIFLFAFFGLTFSWGYVGASIMKAISTGINAIGVAISTLAGVVGSVADAIAKGFGVVKEAATAVAERVSGWWESITTGVSAWWSGLWD
jgi:hypothetical protein